jgi:hypothetical protein
MPLISLVYTSVSARRMSDDDLKAILEVSRRNNARRHITGMLLFKDGHFIQALEGEESAVLPLYDTIAADPRHQNVYRMYSRRVTERSFGTWEMGFNKLDSIKPSDLPGYTDFLTRPFDPSFLHENPSRAAYLLEYFKTRSVF